LPPFLGESVDGAREPPTLPQEMPLSSFLQDSTAPPLSVPLFNLFVCLGLFQSFPRGSTLNRGSVVFPTTLVPKEYFQLSSCFMVSALPPPSSRRVSLPPVWYMNSVQPTAVVISASSFHPHVVLLTQIFFPRDDIRCCPLSSQ